MRFVLIAITAAAIAAIASNSLAADTQNRGAEGIQIAQKRKVVKPRRAHQDFVVEEEHYVPPPLACRAVAFPRSPLCAGQPYWDSPYGFPFNWTWSW
jgi:hypothetical protein